MATSRASAVIGVSVDLDLLEEKFTVTIPSCEHAERLGNKFCPVCGTRVEDETDFDAYDVLDEIVESLPDGFLATDENDQTEVVIGYGVTADDAGTVAFLPLPDVMATANALKEVLEPIGLWDDERFGLYAVRQVLP